MDRSAGSPFNLTGRVALVTGGAGFLAEEFARVLAGAGARVILADRRGEEAEQRAASLGSSVTGARVDVTDPKSVRALVARVQEEFGRVDALVNNAAHDPKFDPEHARTHVTDFERAALETFQKDLAVDVVGSFLCSQAVLPVMRAKGGGAIVNLASIYALVGPDQRLYERDDGTRGYKPASYAVGKAALDGFTRYLAAYLAGTKIRVNTLTFGGVFQGHDEQFRKRYAARAPLGRMMERHEVGPPLLFLVSDASSYMTGANLVVDGGWTCW